MFPTRAMTVLGGDSFRDEWSMTFDGTNDYVDCGTALGTTLGANYAGDLSVSIWFKANAMSGGMFQVGKHNYGEFSLRLDSDELMLSLNNTGWDMKVAFADTGSWNHVVGVLTVGTEGTSLLYLNGVSVGTSSGSFPLASAMDMNEGSAIIGKVHNDEFNGNISEAAIYNTALTASQVATIYNGREPYNHKEGIATGNLKGWWRMGDGQIDARSGESTGIISDEASGGSYLGPQLLTNGDFTNWTGGGGGNPDNWTVTGESGIDPAISQSSGKARMVCGNGNDIYIHQAICTIGKVYYWEVEITSRTSGSILLETGEGTSIQGSLNSAQVWNGYFIADHASVRIRRTGGSDVDLIFDNAIIKEVVGGYPGIMENMAQNDFVVDTP